MSESASWEASFTVLLIVKRGHGLYTSMSALTTPINKSIRRRRQFVQSWYFAVVNAKYHYTTKSKDHILFSLYFPTQCNMWCRPEFGLECGRGRKGSIYMSILCARDKLRSSDIFEIKLGLISRSYQEGDFDPGKNFLMIGTVQEMKRAAVWRWHPCSCVFEARLYTASGRDVWKGFLQWGIDFGVP